MPIQESEIKNKNNHLLLSQFCDRWKEVSGEYISVTQRDLSELLIKFINENSISSIVIGGTPLSPEVSEWLSDHVDILANFGKNQYSQEEAIALCSKADAGISGVDALIASTGTLVITSRNQGDRLCSSLPPTHIAITHQTPIFPDLETFLKHTYADLSMTFITGPSRTADIEKQLVLGAHGPTRVVILGQVE